MIPCQTCDKTPEKHECARCREILKHDMAEWLRGMKRVYLHEDNQNKTRRPSKVKYLSVRFKIKKRYQELKSYRKVAEEFGLSKSSVQNAVNSYEKSLKDHLAKNA